jgi:hypothetical protein
MRITESAKNAIINVMKSKGLDLKTTYFEIGVFDGNLGIAFTRNPIGNIYKNDELLIVTSSKGELEELVIDYLERDGKSGLVFF